MVNGVMGCIRYGLGHSEIGVHSGILKILISRLVMEECELLEGKSRNSVESEALI